MIPLLPPFPGVYGLFAGRECLYVGSSLNVRRRVTAHNLRGQFDRVECITCSALALRVQEQSAIERLCPRLNKRPVERRCTRPRRDISPKRILRNERERRQMTVAAFASLLGFDKGGYSRIERGHAGLSPNSAQRIRNILGPDFPIIDLLDVGSQVAA